MPAVQVDGDCCCQRPQSKEPSKDLINVRHAAALQSACRRHAAYVMLTTCLLLPFAFDRPSRYAGVDSNAGQHVELPQEAKDQVQCAADPLQTSSFSPAGPVGLDQGHHQLILYAITDTTTPNSSSNLSKHKIEFRNTLPTCKPHPLNRSPARHSIPPSNNPQQYTRQHTAACFVLHSLCSQKTADTLALCLRNRC